MTKPIICVFIGPTTSLQINSKGDEFIIVPESLIRQLKNEIEIEKKKSQGSKLVLFILHYILIFNLFYSI